MMSDKLTPALRDMLARIDSATQRDGALMQLVILAAGGGEPRKLRRLIDAGWGEPHPKSLPRGPVPGVRSTEADRAALAAAGTNARRRV